MQTTNYIDTFIEVSEDCPVSAAEIPPRKSEVKSVANLQYEMIKSNPYKFTSDDVIFGVYAIKNEITKSAFEREKQQFFSKGQACFRSSPLTKRYGWGVHNNSEGKIAVYAVESREYLDLAKNKELKHVKAMRTKRISPNKK